jgi:GNAT superfamily N-acetyltransferase
MEGYVTSLAPEAPQPVLAAEFPFTELSHLGSSARSLRRDIVSLSLEHRTAFRELLLGLDASSRSRRFACFLSDDGILRHTDYAVREAAWIAGLFVAKELCGVVELYECRDPQDIEAAFAVASAWRRQGVGTALLFAAIGWARMSHRSRLRMMFSRNDWPMRRVASKAEPQLDLYMDELIASVTIGGVSRDNLDENGGGNQSLKRQPVAEL